MGKAKTKKFKWRGIITILLLLAILVDTISGIILFITPAGSVARWTNWTFLSLTKDQWTSVHIIFSLLLVVILFGHLYFNWRILVHFLWDKVRKVVNLKRELAVASIITLILFFGTVWNVEPLSSIVNFREDLKRGVENRTGTGHGRGYGENTLAQTGQDFAGRGFGRLYREAPLAQNNQPYFYDQNNQENTIPGDRFGVNQYPQGRGLGVGRRAYAQTIESSIDSYTLKGRDFAQIGKLLELEGTLVKLGDEWGLKVNDTFYEIHMGPSEYRDYKGFILNEGEMAYIKGFVSGTDIAVATMETGGRSITLRDETGRGAWSGSSFSKGGGYNR